MTRKRWLLLATLAIVATVVDQVVIHHSNIAGWIYILIGWFIAWLICFGVLHGKWLQSIAAVFTLSVVEDALFLLWDRIVGRIDWGAPWYCHDWVPLSYNWGGVPSHYVYSLIIAACLVGFSLAKRKKGGK